MYHEKLGENNVVIAECVRNQIEGRTEGTNNGSGRDISNAYPEFDQIFEGSDLADNGNLVTDNGKTIKKSKSKFYGSLRSSGFLSSKIKNNTSSGSKKNVTKSSSLKINKSIGSRFAKARKVQAKLLRMTKRKCLKM